MQTTALLVIDIQRGAFDGVRCPPIDAPDRLIDNASTLIAAARAGGSPVVFVQHCEGAGEPFEEDTVHGQLHAQLVPAPGERVLKKYASSSFERTELDALLKASNIASLVVCGLQSEFCVSNTTRAALQLGYAVQVAEDGHSTWPSSGRSAAEIAADANAQLAQAGATLASTQILADALRSA